MKTLALIPGVDVARPLRSRHAEILSPEALAFLAHLHGKFEPSRRGLLAKRAERQMRIEAGERLDFLPETKSVREASWRVSQPPPDLLDRRVEITGPPERRMLMHALNSGAQVHMSDFEDALSPTWANLLDGQANLQDAVRRQLEAPDGTTRIHLRRDTSTLVVRPRGWHLDEARVQVNGASLSASLFDAGLYAFHNAKELESRGSGCYLYLPKMESHLEARLWHEVLTDMEAQLGLPRNHVRVTVLIETLPAAFEMEEILYELRDRSPALNAGRWDYLFSAIKTIGTEVGPLPDRSRITMEAPFMRAYAQLLVKTCHKRGAYAIGGMSAFVPNRRDPAGNARAIEEVRADKLREARDGFDGTWVAHPDLVSVAFQVFRAILDNRIHQLDRRRDDVHADANALLDLRVANAYATEAGLRTNLRVALHYTAAWLGGQGAVAIDSRMEDTATAEISRAQVWQWCQLRARLQDGRFVTPALVEALLSDELGRLRDAGLPDRMAAHLDEAASVVARACLGAELPPFLTQVATLET